MKRAKPEVYGPAADASIEGTGDRKIHRLEPAVHIRGISPPFQAVWRNLLRKKGWWPDPNTQAFEAIRNI